MGRPKAIPYARGHRVNFTFDGKRYLLKFPAHRHGGNSQQAAEDFITATLSGKGYVRPQSLEHAIVAYLGWAERAKKKSVGTVRADRQRLMLFNRWAVKHSVTSVDKLTVPKMRQFTDYFDNNYPFRKEHLKHPNPDATWMKYYFAISALCRWAVKRGIIERHPFHHNDEFVRQSEKTLPSRIYSESELSKLFDYFAKRPADIAAYFTLLAYSGLRPGEAVRLKWRDVDLDRRLIHVRHTKTKRDRTVPMHHMIHNSLSGLDKSAERVFPGRDWRMQLRLAFDATGVPFGRCYDFRHTFGTNLARTLAKIGGHPKIGMELMGHRDIQTFLIYVHFSAADNRLTIDNFSFDLGQKQSNDDSAAVA